MKEFLSEALIYQKQIIHEYYEDEPKYYAPEEFFGQTFDYYCDTEEKVTTFEIEKRGTVSQIAVIPDYYFKGDFLNYTFTAICTCKSCKKQFVYFLINVYSDKPVSDLTGKFTTTRTERSDTHYANTNLYAQKVGVYPERKLMVNKDVEKFFCRETKTFYYKGIKSVNENYGVGALAYFRRIIEKELINIIEAIKELPDADKPMIEKLIKEHEQNPSVSTIYSNMQSYLPSSLRMLGDNPIKLLYNQTSEGLHSLTEAESIEKANKILRLLEFVILKINEEKSTVKDIKDIIKELKSENKTAP